MKIKTWLARISLITKFPEFLRFQRLSSIRSDEYRTDNFSISNILLLFLPRNR